MGCLNVKTKERALFRNSLNVGETPFLCRGGNTGKLICEFDWASTKLGPIEAWPQSLICAVGFVVHSAVPMVMLCGEDGYMIYNDAYSMFAGGRHPAALGARVREGWPEVAAWNDSVMKTVLAGGTMAYRDQELTLYRNGMAEQVWMNLDYSPFLDEAGRPAGAIAIVADTTQHVLANRRNAVERRRLDLMFDQGPSFMALLAGPEHRFEVVNESYRRLIGGRDVLGKTVAEALPDAVAQGYLEILDGVFRTGKPYSSIGARYEVQPVPGEPGEERFVDFIYQPITDTTGAVTGIFVEGVDVTARTAAEKALLELNVTLEQRIEERTAQLTAREALINTFFKHSSECHAVFGLDESGCLRYEEINPATLRLYKLSREQVIGRTIEEIFGAETAEEINRHLNACLGTGLPRRYVRRLGDTVIEAMATPVPDDTGIRRRVLVSARDVTDDAAREAALVAANKLLEEIATTDALTRINNRRGFDDALAREWRRATRLHSGISLLLFDIDEFKNFNDSQGHLQGDECLRIIANCLRENLSRATDFVARYGGEEFAVLLADVAAGDTGPLVVAERLRVAVEALRIPHPASRIGIVTVSGGIATAWPKAPARGGGEPRAANLIHEADAALYAAKLAGRNRVFGAGSQLAMADAKAMKR
jgi:diguanylate cyclase (GGDEF)-like protein/PAS domain S-box-containing protein